MLTLREFYEKYVGKVPMANVKERSLIDMYGDQPVLCYGYAGSPSHRGQGTMVSVAIFRSAQKMMAFLNGYKVSVSVAYKVLKDLEHGEDVPEHSRKEIERYAMMEEL